MWCSAPCRPGVDLQEVDKLCPSLRDLTVCDSLVNWGWSAWFGLPKGKEKGKKEEKEEGHSFQVPAAGGKKVFRYLTYCRYTQCDRVFFMVHPVLRNWENSPMSPRLLRVTYAGPLDWQSVPSLALSIRALHLEAADGMTDGAMENIVTGLGRGEQGALQKMEVGGWVMPRSSAANSRGGKNLPIFFFTP